MMFHVSAEEPENCGGNAAERKGRGANVSRAELNRAEQARLQRGEAKERGGRKWKGLPVFTRRLFFLVWWRLPQVLLWFHFKPLENNNNSTF